MSSQPAVDAEDIRLATFRPVRFAAVNSEQVWPDELKQVTGPYPGGNTLVCLLDQTQVMLLYAHDHAHVVLCVPHVYLMYVSHVYLIMLLQNTDGFCTSYCGYHSFSAYKGVNVKFSFVGNPGTCDMIYMCKMCDTCDGMCDLCHMCKVCVTRFVQEWLSLKTNHHACKLPVTACPFFACFDTPWGVLHASP
jgi:hypothetical protein